MDDSDIQRNFDIVAANLASLSVSQQQAEERQREWDRRQREWDERQRKGQDRISRAERILLLAIRAGRRERKEWRERHAALIDAQMRTEARTDAGFAKLTESQANLDAAFTKLSEAQANMDVKFAELAEAQATTQRNLDALINVVRKDRQERED